MAELSGQRWVSAGPVTQVTWSFGAASFPSLAQIYGGYEDFSSQIAVVYQATIVRAFEAWEAVANIDFVQVSDAPNVHIRVGNLDIDGRPQPGESSTLGQAVTWYVGETYRAAQVFFDVDAYDQDWFYQVAVHEIGHAIGLDHSLYASSIMYAQTNAQNVTGALTPDDIAGVVAIYGAKTAAATDLAGDLATLATLTLGGKASSVINGQGDQDWFRLDLAADQAYQLSLSPLQGQAYDVGQLRLEVRDASGKVLDVAQAGAPGITAVAHFVPQTAGAYYLAASASGALGGYEVSLSPAPNAAAAANLLAAGRSILRQPASQVYDAAADLAGGAVPFAQALSTVVTLADATTSVATLAYQFFTGQIPTEAGLDYLVSPSGPNPNHLNSPYYQDFNLENRYINFAVNLGKIGEGRSQFESDYGRLSLAEATQLAYREIFGLTPAEAKVETLLGGGRAAYFAAYGGDGPEGLGTKAAMVGWLLAEAEKADLGQYARANAAFLTDLADGATFGVDLVGVYGRPEFDLVS